MERGPYLLRKSKANDERGVLTRIDKVVNPVEPPEVYRSYMTEFCDLLLRGRKFAPVATDEVIRKQNKPLQRARHKRKIGVIPNATGESQVSSFLKLSLESSPIDPRIVSSLNYEHNLALASYVYGFKELLLTEGYYMPGLSCVIRAEKIRQYCSQFNKISQTDFSRFDGSMSYFLREIDSRIMRSAVKPDFAHELNQLLKADIDTQARTSFGVKYNTKASRISGSSCITEGNTIVNAFVDYAAHRKTGHSPGKAYSLIGPKYGDDGLTCATEHTFQEVCKDLGLKSELLVSNKHQPVTFCSRIFVDPWVTTTSITDPKRAIVKIGFSTKNYTDAQNYSNKVAGYAQDDRLTPIFRTYIKRAKHLKIKPNIDLSYGGWPQDKADQALIDIVFMKTSGLDPHTVACYEAGTIDTIAMPFDTSLNEFGEPLKWSLESVEDRHDATPDEPNDTTSAEKQKPNEKPNKNKKKKRNAKQPIISSLMPSVRDETATNKDSTELYTAVTKSPNLVISTPQLL